MPSHVTLQPITGHILQWKVNYFTIDVDLIPKYFHSSTPVIPIQQIDSSWKYCSGESKHGPTLDFLVRLFFATLSLECFQLLRPA